VLPSNVAWIPKLGLHFRDLEDVAMGQITSPTNMNLSKDDPYSEAKLKLGRVIPRHRLRVRIIQMPFSAAPKFCEIWAF
jgi:hypothetical protein